MSAPAGAAGRGVKALELGEVRDVLARGHALVEPACVGQHAEPMAHGFRIARGVDAVDTHIARIRLHERIEHAQRRRLARAVRPEQARDLAVARDEADAFDRLHRAERLVEAGRLDHGPAPL